MSPNDLPYKGLNPYEERDKDNFFGRTADIRILSDKIRARKLTFLFAASGVGKSSLLQAGVMPELKNPTRKHYKPLDVIYYNDWVSNPLDDFYKKALEDLKKQGRLSPEYQFDKAPSLKEFLQFCTLFSSDPLVVILDQFEEFFYYQRYNQQLVSFIKELSAAIHDEDTATAFVISMREDSALKLNAFKAYIPTFLIDNFYRLEKLAQENALAAIVEPVKRVGFAYEPELLEKLLQDLGQREWRDRYGDDDKKPFPKDAPLLIEAPHLQVVCQRLWALDGTRVDKQITLATYQREGRTEGLLKKYFYEVVDKFSSKDKKLASLAFVLLVSRYGTKLARPLLELVDSTLPLLIALMNRYKAHWPLYQEIKNYVDQVKKEYEKDLDNGLKEEGVLRKKGVLQKLDEKRILRRQKRGDNYWYELYHDILAKHVYNWNEGYKRRQFIKKSSWTMGLLCAGLVVGVFVVDTYWNATQVHFRLSPKSGVSDTIEVYRGKLGSFDWLSRQGYRYETDYRRQEIEADKLFNQQAIVETHKLIEELVGRFPLNDRIEEYGKNGQFDKNTLCLADSDTLVNFRTVSSVEWLIQRYLRETDDDNIEYKIKALLPPFTTVIQYLKNKELRAIAASILGNSGSQKAVQLLIALLTDENSVVRCSAAEALGELESREAVQPLIALLTDEDSEVRYSAASALGNIGNSDAVQPLIALLTHENSEVRYSAASALGRLGSHEAVQPLIALLTDKDSEVRGSAARALGQLESREAVQPLIALLADRNLKVRVNAAGALGQLGSHEAVQPIIALLTDEYLWDGYLWVIRNNVASALGQLGNREAMQPLIALLTDEDPVIRNRAAEALGQLEDREAVQPLLIALFTDKNPNVRSGAAEALGQLGNREAVQPLIALLTDKNPNVRRSVAEALGRLGNSEAVQPLITSLTDKYSWGRGGAAEALGQLGSREAVQPLIALLKDEDSGIRGSAASALRNLGIHVSSSDEENSDEEQKSLDMLMKLLENENIHTQRNAIQELGKILAADRLPPPAPPKLGGEQDAFGHPSTLKPLESLATPTTIAPLYQEVVEIIAPKKLTDVEKTEIQAKLAEIVQNPQTIFGVRADALRAIAQFGTKEVAELIIESLKQAKKESDTNLNQKYFIVNALQALGINGDKSALSFLEKELDDLTDQKQHWREQRDTETVPTATTELTCDDNQKPPEIANDKGYWQKESWEIVLGQAIARVDPENEGLKLLRHSLTNVRQGARFGLAQVATAQLVEKLHQQREHSKSYPNDLDEVLFIQSAYRALDEMLIALETIGTEQDFKDLRRLYPQLQDDSVKQRVEWTIGQLEYQYSD